MIEKIVTLGVYGFSREDFFRALVKAQVELFCDLRARRQVRGPHYTFANRKKLTEHLAVLGIGYLHCPSLAPSKELRQIQYLADKANKEKKTARDSLSPAFIKGYHKNHLKDFNSLEFLCELPSGASVACLFCVEQEPEACHRSLVAEKIQQDIGVAVEHLKPPPQ